MELSLCHTKTHNFCPSILPTRTAKTPATPNNLGFRPRNWQNHGAILRQESLDRKKPAVAARCGDEGCSAEVESELEAELRAEEGAEWMREGRWSEKCGDRGMVELLECLEREAIMGEDEGKEPDDYNRRAQIFYKSSRVFQALKKRSQS
ncbi:hypothetical protein D8674_031859 [Pyrus ussuriensis x Pyrus communis]|uniref:Uncharacterized protein n=1 Tax=Pyrus ussuriensis x Pyrus communis TaxID=2448454 RepID=A0A5N5EZX1_9ROSA|nr:hypothetical protein D8674_031859 [Pyrus ussuriensis x Pyrus communis]